MTKPLTAARLQALLSNAQEIRNCLQRHMEVTTAPRSKEREMFRVEIVVDARHVVSALEILLREAEAKA